MNYDKKLKAAARLLEVMDTLREKCPWDREQTFETLRNNTIEETYELVDAIADNNMDGIKEELGDLLLQVDFPEDLLNILPEEKREAALGVLSHDPRPSYQRKPGRVYGLTFAGFDIRFQVDGDVLTVEEVNKV